MLGGARAATAAIRPTAWEVAFAGPAVAVRDSKNTAGPVLTFPAASWTAFLG